ncbi:HdeA/HdeB family chaperone [Granulosicoccus antarcticus]|uniref:Uncharacterized protein n=1 Tax=Granulosicoccus antarcticus IMCC3135 TaxID=1192854 RepID=A0A2Z2NN75_9GAMM|nr:HdeA/HdeB family chaperone [Granulosicoccus antarcticus]ASJ70330.1 hypothetical protein IMCC3135_01030 [Granulosicoccus antarcticus IMCC3135]
MKIESILKVAVLAFSVSGVGNAQEAAALSLGFVTCSLFATANIEEKRAMKFWIDGYLSAQSQHDGSNSFQKNMLSIKPGQIETEIDSHCRLNPKSSLIDGAFTVYKRLGGVNG